MSKQKKRQKEILKILYRDNGTTTRKLAETFKVSDMTIRRDLTELVKEKKVKLVHGAVIDNRIKPSIVEEIPYTLAEEGYKNIEWKNNIGRIAASYIKNDDIIILDVGTTTQFIARFIPNDINVTVLFYSANIFLELISKKNVKQIFAGGYFHEETLMYESKEGIDLIKRNRATKAFISALGVSDKLGVTCNSQYEVYMKQAAIKSSLEKILVVDASKFNVVKPAHFADLETFDMIITNKEIPIEYKKTLEKIEVPLIQATPQAQNS